MTTTQESCLSTTAAADVVGDAAEAAPVRLLAPLRFEGVVLHGAKLGRTIGFPTANIKLAGFRPAVGIYAARVQLADGRKLPGVAYFGSRPTVDGEGELLEVFIFDFSEEIYGERLAVDLIAFVRGDAVFDSLEAMTVQMERDRAAAARLLES